MIDSDNNNGKDIDSSPDCEEINKVFILKKFIYYVFVCKKFF